MKPYRVLKLGTTAKAEVEEMDYSVNSPVKDTDETDEQIVERLRDRFAILNEMTKAVKQGIVKAMIVTGPPGVGKSYGIENVLNRYDLFANVAQNESLKKYEVVKGAISALGLYAKLYNHRESNEILVFDDVDVIFSDEIALNILKAALDSSSKRMIHWNSDSRLLRELDIPNSFEFRGGCIFITNVKFQHVRSKKLRDHLEALESRCHYIDLTIDTEREKMLRIKQIVNDGMLDSYDFDESEVDEIIQFIDDNRSRMRELSLRTVLKVSDLKRAMPDQWRRVATLSVMKH